MASTQTAKSAVVLSSFGEIVKIYLVKSHKLSDFFLPLVTPGPFAL